MHISGADHVCCKYYYYSYLSLSAILFLNNYDLIAEDLRIIDFIPFLIQTFFFLYFDRKFLVKKFFISLSLCDVIIDQI